MLSSRLRACVAARSSVAKRFISTDQPAASTPATSQCGSTGHVHGPACMDTHGKQQHHHHNHHLAQLPSQQHQATGLANTAHSRPLHTSSIACAPPSCGSPGHVHSPACSHTPRQLHPGYRDYHAKGTGSNRGVVYVSPGKVQVASIADAQLVEPSGRKANHGVIIKTLATNICGSDQHMVRGRTTAPAGLVLGHEITGEVVETGGDVLHFKKGDIVSVPFNIACGRCRNCRAGLTGICLTVNPARPGAAYGYVDMGGWIGGQADYVMVPFADFNLLKLGRDPAHAMDKILDLALLSDILPTGYHGCIQAGVTAGSTVYIAGAGPVGLAAAASAQLLGAACVIVGDLNPERLAQARSMGCETVDVSSALPIDEQLRSILGEAEVDCGVDAVGFEARGCGAHASKTEQPASVLNAMMGSVRAGGAIGIPGLYVTDDPGAADDAAKIGALSLRLGLGWAKSISFGTGQCPVIKYHRQLMQAILFDKIKPARAVNVRVVSLEDAPAAYADFDKGASKKFVIDASGTTRRHLGIPRSQID